MTKVPERRHHLLGRLCLGAASLLGISPALADAWGGRELQSVIEELRDAGIPIIYSSRLVRPGMLVRDEPRSDTALQRLDEVLHRYGLGVRAGPYGSILVVRAGGAHRPTDAAAASPVSTGSIEELVVNTSRYELQREPVLPAVSFANTDLERLPDLGEDPLRAVARLPGTAINGLSAKTNIRGGATDETLVNFDDMRLYNPFHLKDFQSVFSSIDPAVIDGMNVYTGAFPASYGDRMSGVIDIDPLQAPGEGYRVLAVSLFNVAGLIADGWHDGQGTWLVSARRGNLDLVVDVANQDIGDPRYSDLHGQVRWAFSEEFSVAANGLVFDDNIRIFDTDREEEAKARYHDSYLWLRADAVPSEILSGYAILSYANLTVRRDGTASQPGISTGVLADRRDAEVLGLATHWTLDLPGAHRLQLGGDVRDSSGRYDYADEVSFDVLFDTPGAPTIPTRTREISVRPEGEYYSTYVNSYLDLPGDWTTEIGLRWERSTLASGSGKWSPRVSLLYQLSAETLVRASWGRYWQTQAIDELPVSDGETTFSSPERADQLVLGLERQLGSAARLRLEAYTKDYANLRPRYENLLNTLIVLPELKPDRVRVAADAATAHGVEATVRSAGDEPLDWWVSYTWSEVRDEISGQKFRRSWDQGHALGAGLLWSTARWDLTAAAAFRTGWPTTSATLESDELPGVIATGPRNGERLGNYATLDLRAARRFQTDLGLVSVFLEVTNSLNRDNDCCVEYGIDVDEGGEFELETIRNLPILPSVGISWQF